jgi:hypothetical protein
MDDGVWMFLGRSAAEPQLTASSARPVQFIPVLNHSTRDVLFSSGMTKLSRAQPWRRS